MQQIIHGQNVTSSRNHTKSPSLINFPIPRLGPPNIRPRTHTLPDLSSLPQQPNVNNLTTSSPGTPDAPELPVMTTSSTQTPKLHPSSFLLGIGLGICLILLKPAAQTALFKGISTLSTLAVALIVWGSIAGVGWFIVKTVILPPKKTSNEPRIERPIAERHSSSSSGRSTRSTSSSPSKSHRSNRSVLSELDDQVSNMSYRHSRTPSPTKNEVYAYRPYGDTRQPLQHPGTRATRRKHETTSTKDSDCQYKIISGEDLHIELEKPADQLAYRL